MPDTTLAPPSSVETPQAVVGLLAELEQRCRDRAYGLPQQKLIQSYWEGVMFYVGEHRFVAPLSGVKEILNHPSSLTPVPGSKTWMMGVANVRGTLIPVVDLQLYLIGMKTRHGRRSRVLVITLGSGLTGVLVGEMVGMRHFARETARKTQFVNDKFSKYVQFEFDQDGMTWPVFSLSALAEDPGFQIAAT
ncbi:MAG: chemotaxis protein CheW [Candidatus Thiodiazotropha endolucinida]|uniref:Chemotaxis protein CheW n=2 Tax=Candidatus Thiodiazotropha TaxID=1913444 RepID=A0A7Z0VMJ3_9GAMM|nr:chemotaxis protein CheW [Candidatus Thiodiazotropha endolucinida]MBT3010745.1 chemotaxis protein CheW [Candidatus Thiodiazotropha sp. (ex Lucina pensylvanica)]MBT3015342.1 chemotaxis protein CheW [Candidatus Thiodiazotropha taylori]MBT3039042.1 chemotaxis protein CheW [Candidatus Thiodiazotropha sp. (ex Codakia orbicularis)]MBV2101979.1 chemotaxis protein CheW [Candidatus Thiodiazotropha sp. (ex Lucina aurantia)]MCU7941857.1 chemotaxis protein CheW [Candidatus Thiodiazotropha sp. (ex Cardio